jgi:uncharacterized membrane protein
VVLSLHVAAGGLALLLGAVALSVPKGGTLHRRSGQLFVGAMLVMAATAAILGNVGGGVMTAYFVVTAWRTVGAESAGSGRVLAVAAATAGGLGLLTLLGGVKAFTSPGRSTDGVPFLMFFFLATVLLLAAAGDVRVLRRGMPRGRPRLARHLWRMCFALFIATGSFFSVRERVARILPEPFTALPMRMLPIVLLFGTMLYWLWRLRGRRPVPGVRQAE